MTLKTPISSPICHQKLPRICFFPLHQKSSLLATLSWPQNWSLLSTSRQSNEMGQQRRKWQCQLWRICCKGYKIEDPNLLPEKKLHRTVVSLQCTDFKSSLSWRTSLKYICSKFIPYLSEASSENVPIHFRIGPILKFVASRTIICIRFKSKQAILCLSDGDDSHLPLAWEFKVWADHLTSG